MTLPNGCCNGMKGWATKEKRSTTAAARFLNGCSQTKKLIPKAKGPYSVCRMSPLRPTYLTGSGADERGEGKPQKRSLTCWNTAKKQEIVKHSANSAPFMFI